MPCGGEEASQPATRGVEWVFLVHHRPPRSDALETLARRSHACFSSRQRSNDPRALRLAPSLHLVDPRDLSTGQHPPASTAAMDFYDEFVSHFVGPLSALGRALVVRRGGTISRRLAAS